MAVEINYAGNAAGLWTKHIIRRFIPALRANTVVSQFAEPAILPKNQGVAIARWNIPSNLAVDTTALAAASATDNEVTEITVTSVEATIGKYGQWMKIDDLAEDTVTTSALDMYADTFAFNGAETIDTLIKNAVVASTSFLHAGDTALSGATLITTDRITANDFAIIGGLLRANKAKGFSMFNGKYALLVPPEVETNIVTDVTTTRLSWSEVNKHVPAGFEQVQRKNNGDIVGTLGRVTCMLSDVVDTAVEDSATAYRCMALARYGVGWLGLGKSKPKPQIIIKRSGSQDTSNPLNQYSTIGWFVKMVTKLLDVKRAIVVYSAI